MTDGPEHDCQEGYQECMAARRARVERVIKEADPWETNDDLAVRAGVHLRTVLKTKALLQTVATTTVCNNGQDEDEEPANDFGSRRNIIALEKILQRCTKAELAYAVYQLLPAYRKVLKRINYTRTEEPHHDQASTDAAGNNPAHAAD